VTNPAAATKITALTAMNVFFIGWNLQSPAMARC
jgi:hypothetical protein